MKKNILKKTLIICFVAALFFSFYKPANLVNIKGYNFDSSVSWRGEDLGFSELKTINYESNFLPFSNITESVVGIDLSKTYVIENAYDLYMFSYLSKGTDRLVYLSLNYVLGNDIDYFDVVSQDITTRFHPVGFMEPFNGTFDGQGFEITNLYFQTIMDEDMYDMEYPGLRYFSMFSKVGVDGEVKNIGLINPIIIQPLEWGNMQYVSALVGENRGLIKNVYLRDTREDASGFHAEGAFEISGLVSNNIGQISNIFVVSKHIKSRAVIHNVSVSPVVGINSLTLDKVYYDQTIYSDLDADLSLGNGIDTIDFKNHALFSDSWFFYDSYLGLAQTTAEQNQLYLKQDYPILKGLRVSQYQLEIMDAMDLLYMNQLLLVSGLYRSSEYVIKHDIDMNQVSRDAYIAAPVGFNGVLKSNLVNESNVLYPRNVEQGGDPNYHSIINLSITNYTLLGKHASYALFASLFGTVKNINFVDFNLKTEDLQKTNEKKSVTVGLIAGQMNGGIIENVHSKGIIEVTNSSDSIGRILLGGLVGRGSGSFKRVSHTGTIDVGIHALSVDSNHATAAGIIGESDFIYLNEVINASSILGPSYETYDNQYTYVGGIIGKGSIEYASKVINLGNIISNHESGYINHLYLGGLFGLLENLNKEMSRFYNYGSLQVNISKAQNIKFAGIGSIDTVSTLNANSLTNNGQLILNKITGVTLSESELNSMQVQLAGTLIIKNGFGTLTGLFNEKNISADLSLVNQVAGILISEDTTKIDILQAYNKGNISLTSNHLLTQDLIKISGMFLGQNMSVEHFRNEGNINITLNQSESELLTQPTLLISGLLEEVSQDHFAINGFNGGSIIVYQHPSISSKYLMKIAGIALRNLNTNHYIDQNIDYQSIDIKNQTGNMDHVLNHGDISVLGNYQTHIYASGIVLYNYSMITNAINLGDISVENTNTQTAHEVELSGIAYQMIGAYAQIRDSANNGKIEAISHSTLGIAHASGIAVRNERLENGSYITGGMNHQFAKIMFSINYGDVYAWSESDESSFTITNETRTKASGILSLGVLSTINNVNHGNIYSKYLSSGIFGFVYLNRFGTLGLNQVYISNSINYGKVRAITDYDLNNQIYTINMNQLPTKTAYNAYGAMVGKIHTGTSTWAFAGDVTYPIDRIYFGYLINFDEKINMFSNAPELSSTWADGFGNLEEANEVILNMLKYMSTTNPNDQSAKPFTYFYQGGWIGQYMGKVIDYYEVSDTEDGMFYENFALRSFRPVYSGTDQYIRNFIEYIPRDKVNPNMIDRLESDSIHTYPGIYALSSSAGIGQGIFIPDNFNLEGLSPYTSGSEYDTTWLGLIEDQDSISYHLRIEMRQIQMNFASTIYDLKLVESDALGNPVSNGFKLEAPIIDEKRGLLTYYIPSNASILNQQSFSLMDIYSFVEVSEGLGRKVPDIVLSGSQTYTWVGDYKKDGQNYVEIGPYHTTGIYDVITNDTEPITSYNRDTPVYSLTHWDTDATITPTMKHTPHTYVLWWWQASGYRATLRQTTAPGYAAYERFTLSGYPNPIYRYVGPSMENVTYIQTDVTPNVIVYDQSNTYFKANLEEGSYTISKSASFSYGEESYHTLATIPRSFGIYDAMYDSEGNYIDSVSDHYGAIRIYSSAYNALDPSTYRDYDIRIIRTADVELLSIEALIANGMNAMPTEYTLHDVTSTEILHHVKDNDLGTLKITYETLNLPDLYNLLPSVEIYEYHTSVKVHSSYYDLTDGIVKTDLPFNNLTGSWGVGSVSILFSITELFPSGDYYMETTLLSGELFTVYFSKAESSEASVLSITHQNLVITPTLNTHTSMIPYGIYYQASDSNTEIVNFSNISSLTNIYYDEMNLNIPSYLTGIEISPFSTLLSIDLAINLMDQYRYQYIITYYLRAEDGTLKEFTHKLEEYELSDNVHVAYLNGGELDLPLSNLIIGYEDQPTLRIEHDFSKTYFHTDTILSASDLFTPDEVGQVAIRDLDFFIQEIPNVGYEIDFNKNIPLGVYEYQLTYQQEINLWGQLLSWNYEFVSVTLTKVQNDNSLLDDILFVTETVFAGFNTIMDYQEITLVSYQNYLENPNQRTINILPTKGIIYNEYDNYPTYWVIGQVQQTNTSVYAPVFKLPEGAIIRKVTNFTEIGYSYQSEDLTADFSPIGDSFNFILYRVYAMDFDQNNTHYTDYYVAVQDVTNNIRFNLTVINSTETIIENVYIRINLCQLGENYEEACKIDESILSMAVFSHYDSSTGTYSNNQFQTTSYGTYSITATLPKGFGYVIQVQQQQIIGNAFYLENSILPRKYYVTLTIINVTEEYQWGQQEVVEILDQE